MTRPGIEHYPADLFGAIGLQGVPSEWKVSWEESEHPGADENAFYLQAGFMEEIAHRVTANSRNRSLLLEARDRLRDNPHLSRLAWYLHRLLFVDQRMCSIGDWPDLGLNLGLAGALFYALLLLSGVPRMLSRNQALGVSDDITYLTLGEVIYWMDEHQRLCGEPGLDAREWLLEVVRGKVFRLGRLMFTPDKFIGPFRAYRHIQTHRVVLLAEDGQLFRGDGQLADCADGREPWGVWTSVLVESAGSVCGNPADPRGLATNKEVRLATAEWQLVLERGDDTMGVHIPGGEPMHMQDCAESFAAARSFFPLHFPDYHSRAYTCVSWLVDPVFEKILDPDSNIVRFLKEWYLHPFHEASGDQTYYRIFGAKQKPADPATLPQVTSLQRAVASHLRDGGSFYDGGAVLFEHDLAWGNQVYRQQNERNPG